MDEVICVKCQKPAENRLPLCEQCRQSLYDFIELAKYLNAFNGSKDDLLWIIGSELSRRESSIINSVRLEFDYARGNILFIPIEPADSTIQRKPWLWDRYLHIKDTISEMEKLMKARNIAIQHYPSEIST